MSDIRIIIVCCTCQLQTAPIDVSGGNLFVLRILHLNNKNYQVEKCDFCRSTAWSGGISVRPSVRGRGDDALQFQSLTAETFRASGLYRITLVIDICKALTVMSYDAVSLLSPVNSPSSHLLAGSLCLHSCQVDFMIRQTFASHAMSLVTSTNFFNDNSQPEMTAIAITCSRTIFFDVRQLFSIYREKNHRDVAGKR